MRYSTRDSETGCVIDDFETLKEAEKQLKVTKNQTKKLEHMKKVFMKSTTTKNKRS